MIVTLSLAAVVAIVIGAVVSALTAAGVFVLVRRSRKNTFRITEEDNDRLARRGGHLSITSFQKNPAASLWPSALRFDLRGLFRSVCARSFRRKEPKRKESPLPRSTLRKSFTSEKSPPQLNSVMTDPLPPPRAAMRLCKPELGPRPAPKARSLARRPLAKARYSEPVTRRYRDALKACGEPRGPRPLSQPGDHSITSGAIDTTSPGREYYTLQCPATAGDLDAKRSLSIQLIGEPPAGVPPSPPRDMRPYMQAKSDRTANPYTQSIDSFESASSSILRTRESLDTDDQTTVAALEALCGEPQFALRSSKLEMLSRPQLGTDHSSPRIQALKRSGGSALSTRPRQVVRSSYRSTPEVEPIPRNNSSALSMGLMDVILTPEKRDRIGRGILGNTDQDASQDRLSQCSLKRSSRQPLPVIRPHNRRVSTPSISDYSRRPSLTNETGGERRASVDTESSFHFEPFPSFRSSATAVFNRDSKHRSSQSAAAFVFTLPARNFGQKIDNEGPEDAERNERPAPEASRASLDGLSQRDEADMPFGPSLSSLWPTTAGSSIFSAPESDDASLQPQPLRTNSKLLGRRISQIMNEQDQALALPEILLPAPSPGEPQTLFFKQEPHREVTTIFSPSPRRPPSSIYPDESAPDWPFSSRSASVRSQKESNLLAVPPLPHSIPKTLYGPRPGPSTATSRPSTRDGLGSDTAQKRDDESSVKSEESAVGRDSAIAIGDLASILRRMDSQCDANSDAGYFDMSGAGGTSAARSFPLGEISGNRQQVGDVQTGCLEIDARAGPSGPRIQIARASEDGENTPSDGGRSASSTLTRYSTMPRVKSKAGRPVGLGLSAVEFGSADGSCSSPGASPSPGPGPGLPAAVGRVNASGPRRWTALAPLKNIGLQRRGTGAGGREDTKRTRARDTMALRREPAACEGH